MSLDCLPVPKALSGPEDLPMGCCTYVKEISLPLLLLLFRYY